MRSILLLLLSLQRVAGLLLAQQLPALEVDEQTTALIYPLNLCQRKLLCYDNNTSSNCYDNKTNSNQINLSTLISLLMLSRKEVERTKRSNTFTCGNHAVNYIILISKYHYWFGDITQMWEAVSTSYLLHPPNLQQGELID